MSKRARCYPIPHAANETKLDLIREILPHWQRGLVHVQYLQVTRLKQGIRLGWLQGATSKALPSYLSQRQWKSVTNQTNAALKSWQALAKLEFRVLLRNQELPAPLTAELHLVNNTFSWWTDNREILSGKTVSQQALDLSRLLITQVLRTRPFPDLSRIRTMVMDGAIAGSETSTGGAFSRWMRIATLLRGKPVLIPLVPNAYFTDQSGVEANMVQVRIGDHSSVTFSRVKMSDPADTRESGTDIGLDWGVSTLAATSDGQMLGQGFYTRLAVYDRAITELQKALSRNGIKFRDSGRWRNLTRRIRAWVRNEIGRVLNRLAANDIQSIIVENLDFRGKGFSRTLTRIVSRAGRTAFTDKLASVEQDFGITVTEINSAYTSQECSGCGFASRKNRVSQRRFTCGFCGKACNADVNAARVIRQRRSLPSKGFLYVPRQKVLAYLDTEFESRWGSSAAETRERQSRGRSTAVPSSPSGVAA